MIPFVLINALAGALIRNVGVRIDNNIYKTHPVSLCVIGGMQSDIFIVVFQRNLYSSIGSWESFFLFTFITHFFDALIIFIFLKSFFLETTHNIIVEYARERIAENAGESIVEISTRQRLAVLYATASNYLDGSILKSFLALLIAQKHAIFIATSMSYLLLESFLRYGYNQNLYDPISLSEYEYTKLMTFVTFSIVLRVIAFLPVDYLLLQQDGSTFWNRYLVVLILI